MKRLNIANASAYYVLTVGHGLTDSLGKNLTLKTWNCNDEKPRERVVHDIDQDYYINKIKESKTFGQVRYIPLSDEREQKK